MAAQGVQSLGLIVALLVPGGLFLWSYERKASSYGRRDFKDRVIRLAAASVILLTVTAPVAWYAYIEFWQGIINGEANYTTREWLWRWFASGSYLAIVFLFGPAAASANQTLRDCIDPSKKKTCGKIRKWIAHKTLEQRPNPTAFEFLAANGPFVVRVETKSHKVLAGLYGNPRSDDPTPQLPSHASTDPQNCDLYLHTVVLVDEDGNYVRDQNNDLTYGQGGLYIAADAIESAQIVKR